MRETESKHFTVEKLSDGVFAAFHREGGWAIANAGFIDLGDTTIVFDTFLTPDAALDLQKVAEAATGKSVDKVINSHYHNDHIWGNQVFKARSEIISSIETRRLIQTSGMEEYDWYSEHSNSRLLELQNDFDATNDEQKKRDIRRWITYYEGLVDTMPTLDVCLPNSVFDEKLEIRGTDLSVELTSYENAHTGSDTILWIPSNGIIFMSDLLFVGSHPYLADGDAENLSTVLASIMEFGARIYVPGHGPAGTRRDVDLMNEYISACYRAAEALIEEGTDPESSPTVKVPRKFRSWGFPSFFETNVRSLDQRML